MIEESEGTPSTALREIALLKRLEGNRHILHLMETERSKTCLTLIFELCQQDLKKFMDGYKRPSVGHASLVPGPVPADIARDLTYQMLTGIQSMHDGHVMHRDLKVCLNGTRSSVVDWRCSTTHLFIPPVSYRVLVFSFPH